MVLKFLYKINVILIVILQKWLLEQQPEYLWQTDAIWVQHYDVVTGCAAFVNRQVRSVDCALNIPFICESGMFTSSVLLSQFKKIIKSHSSLNL